MDKNWLKKLNDVFSDVDQELREKSACPICGKPKDGIVPVGKSPTQAGLCTGHSTQQPPLEN